MPTINLKSLKIGSQCKNMFGYIYLTTNTINNKKYIGQRRAFNCSPEEDDYLGSGTILQRAIKLYGKENFIKEVLECCDSFDELNEAEKKWIAYYNAVASDEFYNIAFGGLAGDNWTGKSEEDKEKFREKIRESNKNRSRDSQNISGNKNPAYGKKWCNDGARNYLLPMEDIISRGLTLGLIRTPEHNQKISESLKGKKHNYAAHKNKVCYNNGKRNKFINKDDIPYYENNGWVKGMINTRWDKQYELS